MDDVLAIDTLAAVAAVPVPQVLLVAGGTGEPFPAPVVALDRRPREGAADVSRVVPWR